MENWSDISRCLSHMLRHEPWLYELELDDSGWAALPQVLDCLRAERPDWQELTEAHLVDLVGSATRQRHEVRAGRIRALYGHSLPGRILMLEAAPPALLYHGTSPLCVARISEDGLRPMSRQYVHLSTDRSTAAKVGSRKSAQPAILQIHARDAHAEGIKFFKGNELVWLAVYIPRIFIF